MRTFSQEQISKLRENNQTVNIALSINKNIFDSQTGLINECSLVDFENGFNIEVRLDDGAIPINANCELIAYFDKYKLQLFAGKITKIVSIGTNRSSITVSNQNNTKLLKTSNNKYEIIARSGGVLCGAVYGSRDPTFPHLYCSVKPSTVQLTSKSRQINTLSLQIKEKYTRYPLPNRRMMIWIDDDIAVESFAIDNHQILLVSPLSVNIDAIVHVYDECDMTLRSCQSPQDYKGDAYASNPTENGLDYHAVDVRYGRNWNTNSSFSPEIQFDPFNREINKIRKAQVIDEDEEAAQTTEVLGADFSNQLAEQLKVSLEYGSWIISTAVLFLIGVTPVGQLIATGVVIAINALEKIGGRIANFIVKGVRKIGESLQGLFGGFDDIVQNIPSNSEYIGYPDKIQNWKQSPQLMTLSQGVARKVNFGRSIVNLNPIYKSYKLLSANDNYHWSEDRGIFNESSQDFYVNVYNAVGTNNYIFGGLDLHNTTINRIYSRYDTVGYRQSNNTFAPDFRNYSYLEYEPHVEGGHYAYEVNNRNITITGVRKYNRVGRFNANDNLAMTSKMLQTKNWAGHLVPQEDNQGFMFPSFLAEWYYWGHNVGFPYIVLRDRWVRQQPKHQTLKYYDATTSNDDILLECAYKTCTSLESLVFVQADTEVEIYELVSDVVSSVTARSLEFVNYQAVNHELLIANQTTKTARSNMNNQAMFFDIQIGRNHRISVQDTLEFKTLNVEIS